MVKGPSKVKITVLKCFKPEEIFKEPPVKGGPTEACDLFKKGDVFIVEGDRTCMPEGFCPWAWNDIFHDVMVLRCNGDFYFYDEPGVSVNCCTDALRPVIFKLERISDSNET